MFAGLSFQMNLSSHNNLRGQEQSCFMQLQLSVLELFGFLEKKRIMHQTINSRNSLKGKMQRSQTLKEELELIWPDFSKQNAVLFSNKYMSLFLGFLPFTLCKSAIINPTKYFQYTGSLRKVQCEHVSASFPVFCRYNFIQLTLWSLPNIMSSIQYQAG